MAATVRKRVDRGIYQVGTNVYEIVISAGVDPKTGKYRQVWRRHHGNLTSARTARRKLLDEAAAGQHSVTAATVNELFDAWLADRERLGRAPKTIRGYRDDARFYWRPALGEKAVAKVQLRDLRSVLDELVDRGLSSETIRHVRACVSGAFSWAMREEWITRDPTKLLEIPASTAKRPIVPTPEEVVTLLKAAKASPIRPEFERVIWLAAVTGARNSEIRALRVSDFDLQNGRMGVERALSAEEMWTTKNRQIRDVAIDQQTVDVILDQIAFMEQRAERSLPPDAYLFSDDLLGREPWREEQITKFFSKLADDIGRPDDAPETWAGPLSHLTFKHLRKFMSTYGRELGFTGEAVADRAGHDPAVAERHYRGKVKSDRDLELSAGLAALLSPLVVSSETK